MTDVDLTRTRAEPALAVVATNLVTHSATLAISGRTARELAAALGVDAGAPLDLYKDGSGLGVDDVLVVDPDAAAHIADAYACGDAALRLLAPDIEPVLWPEHFDVVIYVDDFAYGVSPGDDYLAEPYAYVSVDSVPAEDPYWNAPFGTAQPMTSFIDAGALRDYFADARHRHP